MGVTAPAARSRATLRATFYTRRCIAPVCPLTLPPFIATTDYELRDCVITAALRCAPPQNKPTPEELRRCFQYLVDEIRVLDRVRVIVGLGAIGTKAAIDGLKASGFAIDPERPQFGHGVEICARKGDRNITLVASFHPSRQNTNTGKLTVPMFDAIFSRANELARKSPPHTPRTSESG